jgi:polyhydroxyalkanoate synthesis regulator phasin
MTHYTKIAFFLLICTIISTNTSAAQSYLTAAEKSRVDSLEQEVDSLEREKSRLSQSVEKTVKLATDATLRSNPSPVGDEIAEVEFGTSVKVLKGDGDDNSYVLISNGSQQGWVNRGRAFGSKAVMSTGVAHLESEIEKLERRISAIKTPTCEERLGGGEKAGYACAGSVVTGMTKEMVKEAWGEPKDVNTTVTEYSRREQWVYGSYQYSNRRYVYFEDGIVTTIQR